MNVKRRNMRVWRIGCLLSLLGMLGMPLAAQSPAVPSDKVAWDVRQDASGLVFRMLIDGQTSPLSSVTCGVLSGGIASCSAPLPAMTPGVHSLQIVASLTQGGVTAESAPSAPLSVSFIAVVTPENVRLIKG